jgi:hypothetical protein
MCVKEKGHCDETAPPQVQVHSVVDMNKNQKPDDEHVLANMQNGKQVRIRR